ncbi:neutral alpha-glucosidase AB-like [Chiloscyllium plagiosum]|uniref:neutral alpha-glucosidase AB-like n=1 Tax=Chiloscyllium plagiosum TaxID=36176 RepID=UPI001CB81F6A|nr:neutral alpha-glucosidase AB-like [Chiloscyllium plagiosum]
MADDPYTLYVAVNAQNTAQGDLFIDDGHTFNFEKRKEYIYRKFVFVNNSLTSSADPVGHYKTAAWIERILVLGARRPVTVTIKLADGTESNLNFEYNVETLVLTIRKPAVNVNAEWSLYLR